MKVLVVLLAVVSMLVHIEKSFFIIHIESMKTPWHYVVWRRPALNWETEQFLASMFVRRGRMWALLVFWGLILEKRSTLQSRVLQFLDCNYVGVMSVLLILISPLLNVGLGWQAVVVASGVGWMVTVVIGSLRYLIWIESLLDRWTGDS